MNEPASLLSAEAVSLHYKGLARLALDEVSVNIRAGRTLGVVGESGSGKSSLARVLMGLETLSGGRVLYRGRDIDNFDRSERMNFRRRVQMVFQDPFNSLNPRKTIGATLTEVLKVHRIADSSPSPRSNDRSRPTSSTCANVGKNTLFGPCMMSIVYL